MKGTEVVALATVDACVDSVALSCPVLLTVEALDVVLAFPGEAAPFGRSKSVLISTLTAVSGLLASE